MGAKPKQPRDDDFEPKKSKDDEDDAVKESTDLVEDEEDEWASGIEEDEY